MSDEAGGLHSGTTSLEQCKRQIKANERKVNSSAQKAKQARPAGFSKMLGNLALLACYMFISVTDAQASKCTTVQISHQLGSL